MAPRTSWKGFLKLSLVSVPVKAYTAHDTSGEVHLNQLHASCHARVKYQKVCPEHGVLESDQIVSGHEYAKDQYVVIDPAEVDKLRPASDKSVRIDGFVPPSAIEPIYHTGKTHYLLPDGAAGSKPYLLLHRGMTDANVVAIAQVVLSGREQLVLLRPLENGLLAMAALTVARYVKSAGEFAQELPREELRPDELALTHTLIEASQIEDFDYSRYQDAYMEKLSELIRLKVEGKQIVQAPDVEEPRILNLMDALKRSVAEAQAAAPRKLAASVTARKGRAATSRGGARKRKTG